MHLVEEDAFDRHPIRATFASGLLPPEVAVGVDSAKECLGLADVDHDPSVRKEVAPAAQGIGNVAKARNVQHLIYLSLSLWPKYGHMSSAHKQQ